MSYKILFKGNIEDVVVSDSRGLQLSSRWKNDDLPEIIDIDGNSYDRKAIKAIVKIDNESESSAWDQILEDEREYREWKAKRLSQDPKDRAENTRFMEIIFTSLRDRRPTPHEIEDMKKAQERWFTEHPDFFQANPICYFTKEEINSLKEQTPKSGFIHIKDQLKINMLNFAERHINS